MPDQLPEFSDELPYCDPCGWQDASTEYMPETVGHTDLSRVMNPSGGRWPTEAFLKRTCARCGFQWAEALAVPREQPPDDRCDVTSVRGDRCKGRAGHFSMLSPHRFPPRDS